MTDSPQPRLPRAVSVSVVVVGFVAAAAGLRSVSGIVAPVVLAFVLVVCVTPVKSWLLRHGVPKALATGAVIGTTFALLAAFVGALTLALAQFTTMLPGYAAQVRVLGRQAAEELARLGFGPDVLRTTLANIDVGRAVGVVGNLLGGAGGVLFGLVVVLTMLILMAQDGARLPEVFERLAPERPLLVAAFADYARAVRRYLLATVVLGAVQALLNALLLLVLGVPAAFLWGMLTFLCSFIPNVGFFIAIVPPLVFGGLVGGWPTMVAIFVGYSIINTSVQSVVQPRVVGGAVALSQTLTFLSVLVWAFVLGPLGAILAVPLTLFVRAVLVDADPDARRVWRPLTGDLREEPPPAA